MRFTDVLAIALGQIRANKLRSFFTLLGIIVSVAFLVAVVAIIQGMNAYVRENISPRTARVIVSWISSAPGQRSRR